MASGGSDGEINIWNLAAHQRAKHLTKLGAPVTALAFNRDGSMLAYATGYDWSKGHAENSPDKYPNKLMLYLVPEDLAAKK